MNWSKIDLHQFSYAQTSRHSFYCWASLSSRHRHRNFIPIRTMANHGHKQVVKHAWRFLGRANRICTVAKINRRKPGRICTVAVNPEVCGWRARGSGVVGSWLHPRIYFSVLHFWVPWTWEGSSLGWWWGKISLWGKISYHLSPHSNLVRRTKFAETIFPSRLI